MNSFKKPTKRVALVTGAAGAALIGAVGFGTAAFADGMPTPSASGSTSATAPAAPAPQASGAPAAPTAPGASGSATAPTPPAGPGAEQGEHEPHIGGEVQSVSGSTVTVKDMDGFTRTIALGSGATVTKDGSSSSASAITKGEHIEATGTVASNGTTLNATKVEIGRPAGPGADGKGPKGGPGADGKGPRGGQGQLPTPPAAGQQGGSQQGGTQQGGTQTAPSAPAAPAPQQSGGTTTAPSAPSQSAPVQGS